MRIGVDGEGAEKGCEAVISAVNEVSTLHDNVTFVIFGNKEKIDLLLPTKHKFEVVSSENDVPMGVNTDDPRSLIKEYSDSSMFKGLQSIKSGDLDAFVSNGSTGGLVTGSVLSRILGRIEKSVMPALAATLPQKDGSDALLLDVGANKNQEVKSNIHNAIMAIEYLKYVKGIKKPRIGYINMGEEDNKGNDIDRETLMSLRNYFGNSIEVSNLEPKYILDNNVDIILTDGRAGNYLLKTAAGVFKTVAEDLRESLTANTISKIRAAGAGGIIKGTLKKYDPKPRGGALLLGVEGIVIKSHGSASTEGIIGGINQAIAIAKKRKENNQQQKDDIFLTIKKALQEYKASQNI